MLCLILCLPEHSKAGRSMADVDVVDPAKVAGESDFPVAYCRGSAWHLKVCQHMQSGHSRAGRSAADVVSSQAAKVAGRHFGHAR